MKDVQVAQTTLHLLATAIASRAGCIHTVASDGSEVTFDTLNGGRAEFAKTLLRCYLNLPAGTDVVAAAEQYLDEMIAAPAGEITSWECLLFTLGLQTITPRYGGTLSFPDGLSVKTDSDSENPTHEFASKVLERYFGEKSK